MSVFDNLMGCAISKPWCFDHVADAPMRMLAG